MKQQVFTNSYISHTLLMEKVTCAISISQYCYKETGVYHHCHSLLSHFHTIARGNDTLPGASPAAAGARELWSLGFQRCRCAHERAADSRSAAKWVLASRGYMCRSAAVARSAADAARTVVTETPLIRAHLSCALRSLRWLAVGLLVRYS